VSSAPASRQAGWAVGLSQANLPARQGPIPCVQAPPALHAATQLPPLQIFPPGHVLRPSSAPESRHSAWLVGLAQKVLPARQAPIPWVQATPDVQAVTHTLF